MIIYRNPIDSLKSHSHLTVDMDFELHFAEQEKRLQEGWFS